MLCSPRKCRRRKQHEKQRRGYNRKRHISSGRRKVRRSWFGYRPAEAKTYFNKFKIVRRWKGRVDPATERVQRFFSWDYNEMLGLGTRLVVHTLNVDPQAKPVAQPAKVFHTKIEEHIVKELQKLLTTEFIKPIQHLWWLSNILPVKMKNEQRRYCMDFRNLNRVCPKDEFPLPNMDLLIDSTAENAMFSFMDGFSGYNQLWMAPKDVEKLLSEHP